MTRKPQSNDPPEALDRDTTLEQIMEQVAKTLQASNSKPIVHCQTHISHVLLSDRFAYKFKKPVKFDFLDFSTLSKRRFYCAEEIRLNRRLAPDVYLDLVSIGRDQQGGFQLGDGSSDDQRIVEWGVKMLRLPDDEKLRSRIVERSLTEEQLAQVADLLVEFYQSLGPVSLPAEKYIQTIRHHVEDNRQQLLGMLENKYLGPLPAGLDESLLLRIHGRQLELLSMAKSLFRQRTGEPNGPSRIVEGHGDLRPDHIYLSPHPLAIDCIEFSKEYRTIDVADELAFLAVQFDILGAREQGLSLCNSIFSRLGDEPTPGLFRFYQSYRAVVRAKVAALRAGQTADQQRTDALQECLEYLNLADEYCSGWTRPVLIMVRGLMGTGKTTIARGLCRSIGSVHLQTDRIRQRLFQRHDKDSDYGRGLYSEENRREVYEEMLQNARNWLENDVSVVVDGAFLTEEIRLPFYQLALSVRSPLIVVNCLCPEEVSLQRIAARAATGKTYSDARPELLMKQQEFEQPVPADKIPLNLDCRKPPDVLINELLNGIGERIYD